MTLSIERLSKNIYATLAYYDGMDYPMTAFEVWKNLIKVKGDLEEKDSLADVVAGLDDYDLRKLIEEYRGFYFLRGRKELVEKRIDRNKIAAGKLKRLRHVAWFLRFVPFVRMIGVTGRLAMKHAEKTSDWDILVVLKYGHIWMGRTLITAFLQIIGKRRQGNKIKDRVCLNHFITDESLEVATKSDFPEFSAHEFSFMFPVFDSGIFQKFQIRNSWIRDYRINYYLSETDNLKTLKDSSMAKFLRVIGEKLLGWKFLEDWLSDWQSRRIMNNPKTNQPRSYIKATAKQLIFLPEPRGQELLVNLKDKLDRVN
jgi:hypothetical protein